MAGPAVRQAVTQYGWDSEKADAAQAQLVRDCAEYYGLRRTLRAAGVALPTPFVVAPRMGNRGSYRAGHEGHGHHGCCDDTYEHSTSGEVRARLELPPWALRSFLLKAVKDLNHIVRSGQLSYGRTPILRRKVIIGHQLVNADWTRFNATKPVNQNHFGLT